MLPDRESLKTLDPKELKGRVIRVSWKQDVRAYTLENQIGKGQTAIAWHVSDTMGRPFALKVVPKSEYKSHSLDAEATRANALDRDLFARIDFYGDMQIDAVTIDLTLFYGVIVDWIQGRTLQNFLSDPTVVVDGVTFCGFAKDLCDAIQELISAPSRLTHNDLHAENILIRPRRDPLTRSLTNRLTIIDTGQLKTIDRRDALIEAWKIELVTIESYVDSLHRDPQNPLTRLKGRIDWFARTDQEWVVCHLCSLFNKMWERFLDLSPPDKFFLRNLPDLLKQMVDPDHSRRIDDPRRMYSEIETLWRQSNEIGPPPMSTPFDLPSAELIRSDRQLMDLFSEEFPRLDACRSAAPVYIYGPRGSGKSTILRSLSIKALLASENPKEELDKISFLGIYLSSSQELRSRFWLMNDNDFTVLEGHVIRYFNLLLLESLVETFDAIYTAVQSPNATSPFGALVTLTNTVAHNCAIAIRTRLGLDDSATRYAGTSELSLLRHDLRRERDDLWLKILNKSEPNLRPDAQLVFDVVRDLESQWTLLMHRRIVFLIDDYSNQRIPRQLQKRLNQAITFSKQGSPIFKVTSEYDGVDLEGVQEGREVCEVNVGYEYVSLTGAKRYRFLQNVLENRFRYCKAPISLLDVLPLSNVGAVIPMAIAIKEAHSSGGRFHYNGLDTISDLCSGDFAGQSSVNPAKN